MTPEELKELQRLFLKLQVALKKPISISTGRNGYSIYRFTSDGVFNLIDHDSGNSIRECYQRLVAKDITHQLIPESAQQIIG